MFHFVFPGMGGGSVCWCSEYIYIYFFFFWKAFTGEVGVLFPLPIVPLRPRPPRFCVCIHRWCQSRPLGNTAVQAALPFLFGPGLPKSTSAVPIRVQLEFYFWILRQEKEGYFALLLKRLLERLVLAVDLLSFPPSICQTDPSLLFKFHLRYNKS